MTIRVDWFGGRVEQRVNAAGREALRDAGEFLLEESNRTVPIEEGTLQRSGYVDVDDTQATVSYDTAYAVRLHENPQYRFQHGRRGKWLQLTVNEQARRVGDFLRRRMERAFG
jgi:hypothetical protein